MTPGEGRERECRDCLSAAGNEWTVMLCSFHATARAEIARLRGEIAGPLSRAFNAEHTARLAAEAALVDIRAQLGDYDSIGQLRQDLKRAEAALAGVRAALLREDGHYVECPVSSDDGHAHMPNSTSVKRCLILRTVLAAPEPTRNPEVWDDAEKEAGGEG